MSTTKTEPKSAPPSKSLADLLKQRHAADTERARLDAAIREADAGRATAEREASLRALDDHRTVEGERLDEAVTEAARALAEAEAADVPDVAALFRAWIALEEAKAEGNALHDTAAGHLDRLIPLESGQKRPTRSVGSYGNPVLMPDFAAYLTALGRGRIVAAERRGQLGVVDRLHEARTSISATYGL